VDLTCAFHVCPLVDLTRATDVCPLVDLTRATDVCPLVDLTCASSCMSFSGPDRCISCMSFGIPHRCNCRISPVTDHTGLLFIYLTCVCQPHKSICLTCVGLARTVYMHRIWPYIWWFSCQGYRTYIVYIWLWPTVNMCLLTLNV